MCIRDRYNTSGVSGDSRPINTKFSSPVQIPGTTWTGDIYNSNTSVIAKKSDGTVWSWGNGTYGELAQNNRTEYSSPVQIPGTTWAYAAGNRNGHTIATKTDGTLWSWGNNHDGRTAQNSDPDNSTGNPFLYSFDTSLYDLHQVDMD